jgi:hypothetical protein
MSHIKELEDEARSNREPLPRYRVYSIRACGYVMTGCIYAEVKEWPGGSLNGFYRYQSYVASDGASYGVQESQSRKGRAKQ